MIVKFAEKALGGSEGQAALALIVALLEHLKASGALTQIDVKAVIARAQQLSPAGVSTRDKEAQTILAELHRTA
jgi:hypothetical protein